MKKKLYLNFLWHMHQPYYKDDMSGHYSMPWVFLHGIKDYYDMAWYLSRHPGLKATFNLVPSLLLQLKDYESTDVDDRFLQTISKKVEELSNAEILYLMEFLFFSQKETMIDPIARYAQLYRKVGNANSASERVNVLGFDELLDLEVCFLLAWCGEYLRENSVLIQTLLIKQHFTHDEKLALLKELADFIARIVPFYKELQDSGQIEISTSPFYHPIMPLLVDVDNAIKANSQVLMPNNPLSFLDDAKEHIERSLSYYESIFDRKARGIWPSEGSVDEGSLELYIAQGIQWVCTDEAILLKSFPTVTDDLIYKRCRYKKKSGEIMISYRDRNLSDAIGFEYNRKDTKESVEDFIRQLRHIHESEKGSTQVNIILDGENAWEFYRNNGKDFFDALYCALDESEWISTQTMSGGVANKAVEEFVIETILPGSWINGDFALWIGLEEKNLAWELLYQAKRDFENCKTELKPNVAELIRNELMIAQGSDWFWWLGDTHYSVVKTEFDKLFRKHLKNAYLLMQIEVPPLIHTSLRQYESSSVHVLPKNVISIPVYGTHSSFFEWMGAGEINLEKMGGVMDSSTPYVKKLLYGNDSKMFNIALIGNFATLIANAHMQIQFNRKLYCDIAFNDIVSDTIMMVCGEEFVEISIPLNKMDKKQFDLKILLMRGEELLQSIPFHSSLSIDLLIRYPGHWFI